MAIVGKKKKAKPQVPNSYHAEARAALAHKIRADFAQEKFETLKRELFEKLKADNNFNLVQGESAYFPEGLVRWMSRANRSVNTDKIMEAINAGKITVLSVLACVTRFNDEMLLAQVPDALIEGTPTEYGVLQASAQYKQEYGAIVEAEDALLQDFRCEARTEEEARVEA